MFINANVVKNVFQRLSSSAQSGKSFQEKTSSLMYFLAFDVLAKKDGSPILDLPPKSPERKRLSLEYARLVTLPKDSTGNTQQVAELGIVELNGKIPEQRMSSNFYTVPLKKASKNIEPSGYPNRPAPMLRLGPIQAGISWGITYHPDWQINFSKFISEIIGNTPFTDLAIFVCRNEDISAELTDWREALNHMINKRFSTSLADFWKEKIDAEKVWAKHIVNADFLSPTQNKVDYSDGRQRKASVRGMKKDQLVTRVLYLESILDANSIEYNK